MGKKLTINKDKFFLHRLGWYFINSLLRKNYFGRLGACDKVFNICSYVFLPNLEFFCNFETLIEKQNGRKEKYIQKKRSKNTHFTQ